MTGKEITQNNKLIAEFMSLDVLYGNYVHNESAKDNLVTLIKYHSSWDWLMPVVEKILELSNKNDNKTIHYHRVLSISIATKIEFVYEFIIEFIKWYNENKH